MQPPDKPNMNWAYLPGVGFTEKPGPADYMRSMVHLSRQGKRLLPDRLLRTWRRVVWQKGHEI